MNPYDSDELAERIDEHLVISIQYGAGVAAVERRDSGFRVYALEVYLSNGGRHSSRSATLDISGTDVALEAEQLRTVVAAGRRRPVARRPAEQLEGRAHLQQLKRAASQGWVALGRRRWFGDDERRDPVLVWVDWEPDEGMFALHVGRTELLILPADFETAMREL